MPGPRSSTGPLARAFKVQEEKRAKLQLDEGKLSDLHEVLDTPNRIPYLASIPPELFDEIICYFSIFSLNFYYESSPIPIPNEKYFERTTVLLMLSQTCRALRDVAIPRLWSRLDACIVPAHERDKWYSYAMYELKRKADGVAASPEYLRAHIRTLSLTLSKFGGVNPLPSLTMILPLLGNLHTIQILNCKINGEFSRAVAGLYLPSVRTLVIPTGAQHLIRVCPNVTHIRCVGGNGSSLINALLLCKCEVLDGAIDFEEPLMISRLLKNGSSVHTLEMRNPKRFHSTAPPGWAKSIPKLAALPNLHTLILTFRGAVQIPSDVVSVDAARKLLQTSAVKGQKRLVIRRVIPLMKVDRRMQETEETVHSCIHEVF